MNKTLKEHLEEFDENFEDKVSETPVLDGLEDYLKGLTSVSPNPLNENLFSSVSQLHQDIKNRDEIIERKEQEVEKLKSQIVIMERQKSNLEKDLNKSKWLENRVTLATKRVYDDKVKTIINENVDSKLISILTAVARKKQGNQQLNWGGWLEIPENRYLYQVNSSIAEKIFEDTNNLIGRGNKKRTKGGRTITGNYSLQFSGNEGNNTNSYATTDFNPDDYELHLGCTVSYWVRPVEIGNVMFAFGRKHDNNQRFTFGINRMRQSYFGLGRNKTTTSWVNMDTPLEESLLEESGQYWNIRRDMWYHMVLTYDDRVNTDVGTDRKIYVNGVLRDTDNINWDVTGGSTGGMYFGARNLTDTYNNGWKCKLDEVSIFNTSKDATWVSNAYNNGKPTDLQNESGLVGYWKFNEGKGTTIKDYSGNGNHGTFAPISGNTTEYPIWSKDTPT